MTNLAIDELPELTFELDEAPTGELGKHKVIFRRPDARKTFPWVALAGRVGSYLVGELELETEKGQADFEIVVLSLHRYATHLDGVKGRLSLRQLREQLPPLMTLGLWAQFYRGLQLKDAEKKPFAGSSGEASESDATVPQATATPANGSGATVPI